MFEAILATARQYPKSIIDGRFFSEQGELRIGELQSLVVEEVQIYQKELDEELEDSKLGKLVKDTMEAYDNIVQSVKPTSSPGVPYCKLAASNADLLRVNGEEIIAEVVKRLTILLERARRRDWVSNDLTPQKIVEDGLAHIKKVFIKNEPHTREKLRQERYRIIVALSIIGQLVERILYQPTAKNEIKNWETIPSKPGMGRTDQQSKALFLSVQKIAALLGGISDDDVSGWDMSQKYWTMLSGLFTHLVNLPPKVGPNSDYVAMCLTHEIVTSRPVIATSDGRLIVPHFTFWIMLSGRFITSWLNSRIRTFLASLSGSLAISMGDDQVASQVENQDNKEFLTSLSFRIKGSEFTSDPAGVEFCSAYLFENHCEPVDPAKSFYRLITAPRSVERLNQFIYEMRHLPIGKLHPSFITHYEQEIPEIGIDGVDGAVKQPQEKELLYQTIYMNGKTRTRRNNAIAPNSGRNNKTNVLSGGSKTDQLKGLLQVTRTINRHLAKDNGRGPGWSPGQRPGTTRRTPRGAAKSSSRANGNGPNAPRSSVKTYHPRVVQLREHGDHGLVVSSVTKHPSHKTYAQAVSRRFLKPQYTEDKAGFTHESAPVATGTSMEFHGSDEHEEVKHDGLHSSVSGRCFLNTVRNIGDGVSLDPSWDQGSRLILLDISPKAIGGRALTVSRNFQRFKFKKLRLMYVPSVSTATSGTLLMYFSNDVALSLSPTGTRELAHATATGQGVSFPVWQSSHLDISMKQLVSNFSPDVEEAALSSQGIFVVETASTIDWSANPNGAGGSLGAIYLDYELECWEPRISYQIPTRDVVGGTMTSANVNAPDDYRPVQATCTPTGAAHVLAGTFGLSIALPAGITDLGDAQDLFFVGILDGSREAISPYAQRIFQWYDPILGDTVDSSNNGIGFVAKVEPIVTGAEVGNFIMTMYPSLDAASNSNGTFVPGGVADGGQGAYQWLGQAVAVNDAMIGFRGYWTSRD